LLQGLVSGTGDRGAAHRGRLRLSDGGTGPWHRAGARLLRARRPHHAPVGAGPMSLKLFDLTGRTALITGSSRGLGRAFAEGLAGAGARVILNGVDTTRLETAAEEMRAAGRDVLTAAFDVTDEAAIVAAFERFDAQGVAVDILVNNAGIQFRKPMLDLATADW